MGLSDTRAKDVASKRGRSWVPGTVCRRRHVHRNLLLTRNTEREKLLDHVGSGVLEARTTARHSRFPNITENQLVDSAIRSLGARSLDPITKSNQVSADLGRQFGKPQVLQLMARRTVNRMLRLDQSRSNESRDFNPRKVPRRLRLGSRWPSPSWPNILLVCRGNRRLRRPQFRSTEWWGGSQ